MKEPDNAGKRILIIGKERSVFVLQTARDFGQRGYTITLFGDSAERDGLDKAINILDVRKHPISKGRRFFNLLLIFIIEGLDRFSFLLSKVVMPGKYDPGLFYSSPPLKRMLVSAFQLGRMAKFIQYDSVYCHQAYFYGLAGIFLKPRNLIVHPWGSDINKYAISSPLRFFIMRFVLGQAGHVLVGSMTAKKFMAERFKLSINKIHPVNYLIDRAMFSPVSPDTLESLRTAFNVPSDKIIVFSCRRYMEGWGPEVIRSSFIESAGRNPDLFFIILSGQEINPLLDVFESEVRELGISERFKFVKRKITLEEYTQICQVSHYIVSAMTNPDMRSSSILQAVACGCYPILSQQPEYDVMVKEGFSYYPFDGTSKSLSGVLTQLVKKPLLELTVANSEYVDKLNDTDYVNVVGSLLK